MPAAAKVPRKRSRGVCSFALRGHLRLAQERQANCQRSLLRRTHTRSHPDTGLFAHLGPHFSRTHFRGRLGSLGRNTLGRAAILVIAASTTGFACSLVLPLLLFPSLEIGTSFALADIAAGFAALGNGLRSASRWKHGIAGFDFVVAGVLHVISSLRFCFQHNPIFYETSCWASCDLNASLQRSCCYEHSKHLHACCR